MILVLLSPLHKGTIVSAPSPSLFEVLCVTCLRVVLGNHQQRSTNSLLPLSRQLIAEVIRYKWWKDRCKVITSKGQDKRKIIQAYHDVPAYGHPGINRTRDLVAKYYWWPQLAKNVQEYVKGCAQCQQNKVNTRP